jgi:hypothetical protein
VSFAKLARRISTTGTRNETVTVKSLKKTRLVTLVLLAWLERIILKVTKIQIKCSHQLKFHSQDKQNQQESKIHWRQISTNEAAQPHQFQGRVNVIGLKGLALSSLGLKVKKKNHMTTSCRLDHIQRTMQHIL